MLPKLRKWPAPLLVSGKLTKHRGEWRVVLECHFGLT